MAPSGGSSRQLQLNISLLLRLNSAANPLSSLMTQLTSRSLLAAYCGERPSMLARRALHPITFLLWRTVRKLSHRPSLKCKGFSFSLFQAHRLSCSYKEFYPDSTGPIVESQDFARLAADRHFERLKRLLDATKGELVFGGETDASKKFISPTAVKNVTFDDALMESCVLIVVEFYDNTNRVLRYRELFGPVLPIVPIKDIQAAIDYVNSK